MNTKRSGSLPAPRSNASGTLVAGTATEQQSNGANPHGNGQEIDHPIGFGIATQWKRSNDEQDPSKHDDQKPEAEASGFHADFAPKVNKSDETGGKVLLGCSGDGNNGTGTTPSYPTGNSGSRTDDENKSDDSDATQPQQQGHQLLHPNVTVRKQRDHRHHEYKSPRQLIRTASREASPYARNDGGRSTTAHIHNNDAAGGTTSEDHGGLRAANSFDPAGIPYSATNSFQQQHDPNFYAAWGHDTGRPPQASFGQDPSNTLPFQDGADRSMGPYPMPGHGCVPLMGQLTPYSPLQNMERAQIGAQQPVQPVWVDTAQWQIFTNAMSPSSAAESANDASWRFLGTTAQNLLDKMESEQVPGAGAAAGAAAQGQAGYAPEQVPGVGAPIPTGIFSNRVIEQVTGANILSGIAAPVLHRWSPTVFRQDTSEEPSLGRRSSSIFQWPAQQMLGPQGTGLGPSIGADELGNRHHEIGVAVGTESTLGLWS